MASGTVTPGHLSASANGRQITITATDATGADTLHTHDNSSGVPDTIDFVTLEAVCTGSTQASLTVWWGGTTEPDDRVQVTLTPKRPPTTIVDRRRLSGGLTVSAHCDSTGDIQVYGEVDTLEL